MNVTFFNAQWSVLARRWPWAPDEKDAMTFFRDRLKARVLNLDSEPFGEAVERLVARDWNNRPSVEQIAAEARKGAGRAIVCDPVAERRNHALFGIRRRLLDGKLGVTSGMADVLGLMPWLVEDDVRWAWPRLVMHRVCEACGYGLAVIAGIEAVADGVPGPSRCRGRVGRGTAAARACLRTRTPSGPRPRTVRLLTSPWRGRRARSGWLRLPPGHPLKRPWRRL